MEQGRVLLLLRHAESEGTRPGGRDVERPLSSAGLAQARAVGDHLRAESTRVDAVLCSSATRTRQTLDALEITAGLAAEATDFSDRYYAAGADDLLDALRLLPDGVHVALLVGHAPAVPGLTYHLAETSGSDQEALHAIESRFPPATLVRLEFTGPWSSLDSARLTQVRLP